MGEFFKRLLLICNRIRKKLTLCDRKRYLNVEETASFFRHCKRHCKIGCRRAKYPASCCVNNGSQYSNVRNQKLISDDLRYNSLNQINMPGIAINVEWSGSVRSFQFIYECKQIIFEYKMHTGYVFVTIAIAIEVATVAFVIYVADTCKLVRVTFTC